MTREEKARLLEEIIQLTKEQIASKMSAGNPDAYGKFVREADRIIYGEGQQIHLKMAKAVGLQTPDDAGNIYFTPRSNEIEIRDRSSTLGLPYDKQVREDTASIIRNLTEELGIQVITDVTPRAR